MGVIAAAEPAAGVIELEGPGAQAVFLDQGASEMGGFVEVHLLFNRGGGRRG